MDDSKMTQDTMVKTLFGYLKPKQQEFVRTVFCMLKPNKQIKMSIWLLDYMESGILPFTKIQIELLLFRYLTLYDTPENRKEHHIRPLNNKI